MAAIVVRTDARSTESGSGTMELEERAGSRFAAHRACAAAKASVSVQESQTLSRAAAESLANRRREKAASDRLPI